MPSTNQTEPTRKGGDKKRAYKEITNNNEDPVTHSSSQYSEEEYTSGINGKRKPKGPNASNKEATKKASKNQQSQIQFGAPP